MRASPIFFLPQNYFPLSARQMMIHSVRLYPVLYFHLSYPQVKIPAYNRQMQHSLNRKLSLFRKYTWDCLKEAYVYLEIVFTVQDSDGFLFFF